jgi:chromosome segregation ATPase
LKKIVVPAAALALSLMTVGAGLAQAAEPANCADAITALQRADSDHRAAVAADDKAAAAEKAVDDLERAEDRLADAERDLAAARDTLTRAKDRLADLKKPGDGPDDNTTQEPGETIGSEQQIADAQSAVDAAEDKVDDLTVVRNDRLEERNDAVDLENDGDADDLQDEADKTDAAALKKAVDEARDDFNRICIDEDDPTDDVTTTPATPTPAPDVDVTVVTPRGGVATGGGPA